ncbi:MAG TPA: adenylate/guanylate cyclase domain-containing protein [Acidimicrobiia bacterium]|nr:adenylate/guanylate cyclase domain-containing protein [Acidimicrobiia bacterium]
METPEGTAPIWWPPVDAETQRDLVAFLEARGVRTDDIAEAIRDDSLWEVTTETLLATRDDLTLEELAARAGLTADQLRRVLRAVGLDTDSCSSEDEIIAVAGAEMIKVFRDEEATLRLLRVYGSSTRRFAEAAVAAYIATVEKPLVDADATVLAHAKAQAVSIEGAGRLAQSFPRLFTRHLRDVIVRGRAARLHTMDYTTARLAVGFVDLVGFSSLAQDLTPAGLSDLLDEFEDRAYDTIAEHRGQLVKHIGDEIMFVVLEPAAACDIALSLVEAFRGPETTVMPRGGLATGDLLTREGDYYGVEVNLAARLADIAVPQEILVSADTKRLAEKDDDAAFVFEPAGRRALKGFAVPVEVFSLSPA